MNIEKLIQTVGYVLSKYGGVLNYTKLIKLLYLADRKSFERSGRSITGDNYVSMKDGPVLSELYDLVKNRHRVESAQHRWNTEFQTCGYDLRIIRETIPTGKLSDFDMQALDEIDSKFHSNTYSQMIDYVHDARNCPEWESTNTSVPLTKSKILKNIGFSKDDIDSILEEEEFYVKENELLESLAISQGKF